MSIWRAILGSYAAAEKGRIALRALAIVAGLDFATKLMAVALLEEGEPISFLKGAIQLKLVFNPSVLGPMAHVQSPEYWMGVCASGLPLSILAFGLANAESRIRRKVAVISAVFLLEALFGAPLGKWVYPIVGRAGLPPFRILANLAFSLLALRLARSKALFVVLASITAASLANVSTFLVSPPGVVDFLRFHLGPFSGIANLADYVMMLGLVLLVGFVPLRLFVAVLRSSESSALRWVDASLQPNR